MKIKTLDAVHKPDAHPILDTRISVLLLSFFCHASQFLDLLTIIDDFLGFLYKFFFWILVGFFMDFFLGFLDFFGFFWVFFWILFKVTIVTSKS